MSEKRTISNPTFQHEVSTQELESLIAERTDQTMRAVQVLVDHGDEAAREQLKVGPGLLHLGYEGYGGVALYDGVEPRIAIPVLAGVYRRLGVTEARVSTIPTITPGDGYAVHNYVLPILPDVRLTEQQAIYPDGTMLYNLYGHKG